MLFLETKKIINTIASTLSICSSCDFYTPIMKCNYRTSVQMVLTQCYCESLENASVDSHMCSHFRAFFFLNMQGIALAETRQSQISTLLQSVYKAKQNQNLNPEFWTVKSRQIHSYINVCVDFQEKYTKPCMYIFWKSTDARQSFGCTNCKICLKMNIWNI